MRWLAYLGVWLGVIASLVQALDTNVDFEVTFDIDRENGQVATAVQFRNFIQDLRVRAAEPNCLVGQIPVLPQQRGHPTRFFDIVLRVTEGAIRLRFQRDNLYMIGHRIEGGNNAQWFECKPDPTRDKKGKMVTRAPWITGAQYLDFGENYGSLQSYAKQTRGGTNLGFKPLRTSVRDIRSGGTPEAQARAYLVFIQMLAEATRFTDLLNHIVDHWENAAAPTEAMIERQNQWSPASSLLLQDPTLARNRLAAPIDQGGVRITGVTTLASLIQFMAILLRVNPGGAGGSPKLLRRSRGGQCAAPEEGYIPPGRQLVDILSVKTTYDFSSPRKYELYGRIWVSDTPDKRWDIYNLGVSQSAAIAAGNGYEVPLNFGGLGRALSASNHFTIGLDLKRNDIPFGDVLSAGQIEWDAFANADVNVYDSVQTQRVTGETGWADVDYIVMSNAAQAHVELIMLNGDDENPAQVYGTVTASYSLPGGQQRPSKWDGADARENGGQTQSVLLMKTGTPGQDVKVGGKITLRKPFVILPWDQELTITIDLWDHDYTPANPDDPIGQGSAIFTPEFEQSTYKTIRGDRGRIEWARGDIFDRPKFLRTLYDECPSCEGRDNLALEIVLTAITGDPIAGKRCITTVAELLDLSVFPDSSAARAFKQLDQLADDLLWLMVHPCKVVYYANNISAVQREEPDTDESLPPEAVQGTEGRLRNLQQKVNLRDNFTCVVSGFTSDHLEGLIPDDRVREEDMEFGRVDQRNPTFSRALELTWSLLDFYSPGLSDVVKSGKIDEPTNAMLLNDYFHRKFGNFELWFTSASDANDEKRAVYKAEGVLMCIGYRPFHGYQVKYVTWILDEEDTTVTSESREGVPLPSPKLLSVHRALAIAVHLSNARERFDAIDGRSRE
ncbi:Ricin [Drechslerella dactyloides]|uniref:rRNA N-glycosylase n=1 Tax=Drechslerella dactyloides TaxID=74499 RepID=A0AAD6J007_DREDA|nr:Ricin [Drechslerella dactyloides]